MKNKSFIDDTFMMPRRPKLKDTRFNRKSKKN
jgi:hypothetical protein